MKSHRPVTLLLSAITAVIGVTPSFNVRADEAGGSAFTPKLAYTGEAAAMLDGGKNDGSAYAGQLFFGADLDLQKLWGWNGATVKAYVSHRHGTNLARSSIGNSTSVQEIYGGQGLRLANLTLEQKLFDDRLLIEGGRTVANIHFLGSELCGYFQMNAACGNPTFVFRTSGFTWWPVSSWGVHAKAWVTPNIYLHAGAYEVNSSKQADDQHGIDWSTGEREGIVAPFAIGYKSSADARLPALYELGGWQDNSRYTDPLLDAAGIPALVSGNQYAPRHGRSGAFFRFEQQLTRPQADSARGLVLFGSILRPTGGRVIEDGQVTLGVIQKGTFASRPDDSIAFVASRQSFSGIALDNLQLARAAAGGTGRPADNTLMMELSYGIQVTPKLKIQPNLHYIVNPDQFAEPSRQNDLDNALIAGLRFDWSL